MSEFAILTDSSSDLYTALRKEYDIDYVQMHIVMDGKEMPASLDWDEYSPEQLYAWLRDGKLIKTTQVPVEEYQSKFTEYLEQGKDILYLACSSGLSGSINTCRMVAEELQSKYPDRKIVAVDSLKASLGLGFMAIEAAKLRRSGKTIEEVAAFIEENKLKYRECGVPETLSYLKRAGRVKSAASFFGNLLGVKPIVVFDKNGCNAVVKKVRGRKTSLREIVSVAASEIVDAGAQTVGVVHADCAEEAQQVAQMLREQANPKDVIVDYMGPCIGATTGPGTVIIYYVGNEIDFEGK